ncbi:MAG: Gldg family protein [Phycisphaerales bacterium]
MTPRRWIEFAVAAALALGVAAMSVRVASHAHAARLELAARKIVSVDDATRERLRTLPDHATLTYYVSESSRMPSDMRRVGPEVIDVVEALARASDGRLDCRVVDPDAEPEMVKQAARHRAAPFRASSVTYDSRSERTVWSTITIACGPRPVEVVNGIGPAQLPHLQALLLGHLEQMQRPRRPVVALAAPPDFSALRTELEKVADVVDVDLDSPDGAAIPAAADLLFWMRPTVVGPERLRDFEGFIARGGSAVIADSRIRARPSIVDGAPVVSFEPASFGVAPLLADLGMRPVDGLVVDRFCESVELGGASVKAPWFIRSIAPNQDFHVLRSAPSGNLLFSAPTPLVAAGDALERRGWTAHVLATTSAETRILPIGEGSRPIEQLEANVTNGEPAAKQPLITLLAPIDPWKGSIVLCAAATPFEDANLHHEATVHWKLVEALVQSLATPERRVASGALAGAPMPLPELAPAARLAWRAAALLALPLALLVVALARGVPWVRVRSGDGGHRAAPLRFALATVIAFLVCGATTALAMRLPGRLDLTADTINRPSSTTLAAAAAQPVRIDLVFSPRDRLPPRFRPAVKRIEQLVDDLRRDGAPIDVHVIHPESLDREALAELAAVGVAPIEVTDRDEETTSVRSIFSAVRVRGADRDEVLAFSDVAAFKSAEFRLAFAFWRVATGRSPHVAIASDTPRLSAAEAYEFFQKQGLSAPSGTDVYSLAQQLVADNDFRVTHVNPAAPVVPDDVDLLLWLQPRRPADAMYDALSQFLHRGGRAIVAVQHFNIQGRQAAGRDNAMVYWPQPQAPDTDLFYLKDLGIRVMRRVLFDRLSAEAVTESQLLRGTERRFSAQPSALPFVIRAAGANFDQSSPITRDLDDQLFVWGSSIEWNAARLGQLGIGARPLITTSPRAWAYDWPGGMLPAEVLEGPVADASGAVEYLGRVPLAVLFEGPFPLPRAPYRRPATSEPPAAPPVATPSEPLDLESAAPKAGALLVIGGSELFKDGRLRDPLFPSDQFLLNAVATLALGDELGAVAGRHASARGLDYIETTQRLRWRAVVVAAFPAALCLFGLAWGIVRRRRAPAARGDRQPAPGRTTATT